MKWHEIYIVIPAILVRAYISGKIYEHKKNMHHNDSWRKSKK